MLFPPCLEDFREAGTSLFTGADHLEHLLERWIAAIAFATEAHLFGRQPQQAGVVKLKPLGETENPDAAPALIISMLCQGNCYVKQARTNSIKAS